MKIWLLPSCPDSDCDFSGASATERSARRRWARGVSAFLAWLTVREGLQTHLEEVKRQRERDLALGMGRAVLPFALDRNTHVLGLTVSRALSAALHVQLGVSFGRIATLFRTRFGLTVSRSTPVRALHKTARQAQPTYAALCDTVRGSPVVVPDETGWKVAARLWWLWVFATRHPVRPPVTRPIWWANIIIDVVNYLRR